VSYTERVISRSDAEALVASLLPTLGFAELVVDRHASIENPTGWIIFVRRPEGRVPDSWRNTQRALFPEQESTEPLLGMGPVVVTKKGEVFGTTGAHPLEVNLADIRVMARTTFNPWLVLRYWLRRIFDRRTPWRIR
jgi:hypothetical protein